MKVQCTCNNPSCGKQFERDNWRVICKWVDGELRCAGRSYCSRSCKDQHQVKYTNEVVEYIGNNLRKKSLKTMSNKIGTTPTALRNRIYVLKLKSIF